MKKLTFGAITLGLSFTILATYKPLLHNLMSHHPINRTNKEYIEELPKMLFTRGPYDGIPDDAHLPFKADLNAIYLKRMKNPFPESSEKPSCLTTNKDVVFYDPLSMVDFDLNEDCLEKTSIMMLEKIKNMKQGDVISLKEEGDWFHRYYWHYGERLINMREKGPLEGFGNFTLSLGYDEKGRYLSFYDVFDFSFNTGGFMDSLEGKVKYAASVLSVVGEPIHFYKRWYFKDVGLTDSLIQDIWDSRLASSDSWYKALIEK